VDNGGPRPAYKKTQRQKKIKYEERKPITRILT